MTKLARAPRTVELEAPVERAHLRTTIEEHGFAQTITSNPGEPRELPKRLLWRPPTDEVPELNVRGLLGQGGMSQVLLVEQPSLNREVAVKVPRDSGGAELIFTEARLNGLIEHPGVIPVYALASDDAGRPALVMRKVDAVSWRQLLADGDHPLWRQLDPAGDRLVANVRVLLQLCNTLAYAHSRGVIHRDLKPENVLIGGFGEVFLADWGVATAVATQQSEYLVGTAAYLAPEMARGERVDERTDVFLIGSTLFALLTGDGPWQGETLIATLKHAASGAVPPLPADAPRELAEICRKAMAPVPVDRFASALEVRHALEQWLAHRASQAISDETERRLDELAMATREKTDRERIYRLLAECRFGFGLARREWSDNRSASQGLERAVLLVTGYELAQGHGDAARALVSELERPPLEIQRAITQLLESQQQQAAQLSSLLEATDTAIDARRRTAVVLTLAAGLSGFIIAGVGWPHLFTGRWSLVLANVAFDALIAVTWLVGRIDSRRLTWLNRSMLGSIVVLALGALVFRFVAALLGLTHLMTLCLELLAFAMGASVLGLTVHRGLYVVPPGALATIAVMIAVGQAPLEIYTVGLAAMLGSAALAIRAGTAVLRVRRDDARDDAPR
ncbi:MAG: serine/threonine protein kinase [Myxococcaceae bacterium]|nr:serine/threonine protein kinase [Myxococcaceae bacterium]